MPETGKEGFGGDGDADDFLLYGGLAFVLLILGAVALWFSKSRGPPANEGGEEIRRPAQGQRVFGINRRQVAARNRRGRPLVNDSDSDDGAGAGRNQAARESDDSDREVELDERLSDPKLGAKKRAKLEAKLEKKSQREAEERFREDKKVRQAREEIDRITREQQELEAERRREAEEKRLREEQAQRELEAYLAMKESFSVEGEGCEAVEEEEEGNLIEKFINHIQEKKVILFEELATQFGLKVPDAIDRLKVLVEEGRLTGVMDDRGKFIYISEEELKEFAKFIKQRGRVSISDLVENSASLITLQPDEVALG